MLFGKVCDVRYRLKVLNLSSDDLRHLIVMEREESNRKTMLNLLGQKLRRAEKKEKKSPRKKRSKDRHTNPNRNKEDRHTNPKKDRHTNRSSHGLDEYSAKSKWWLLTFSSKSQIKTSSATKFYQDRSGMGPDRSGPVRNTPKWVRTGPERSGMVRNGSGPVRMGPEWVRNGSYRVIIFI